MFQFPLTVKTPRVVISLHAIQPEVRGFVLGYVYLVKLDFLSLVEAHDRRGFDFHACARPCFYVLPQLLDVLRCYFGPCL